MEFYEEILELMKKRAKEYPDDYVNPYFIWDLTKKIESYYDVEMPDEIYDWMNDMMEM